MKINTEAEHKDAVDRLKQLSAKGSTSSHELAVVQELRRDISVYEKVKEISSQLQPIKSLMPAFHKLKIIPLMEEENPYILIPVADRKHKNIGVIVEVGPGTPEDPMQFKKGQQVLFPIAGNLKHTENGIDYFFINQFDIIAYSDEEMDTSK